MSFDWVDLCHVKTHDGATALQVLRKAGLTAREFPSPHEGYIGIKVRKSHYGAAKRIWLSGAF